MVIREAQRQQMAEYKVMQDATRIMFASIPMAKENRMVKSTLKEMNIKAAWVQLLLQASRFAYNDLEKKEIKAIVVLYPTRSCFLSQPTFPS